jgi:excisionase family DNA binding protein
MPQANIAHKKMPESLITSLDQRKTVSSREVADILGLSLRVIQKYAKAGVIPGAFQPRGKRGGWRFRRDLLETWWAETANSNQNATLVNDKTRQTRQTRSLRSGKPRSRR